ncbi:histidine kinase [Paludicola sp. MB14-C6]|uniref:sensor histidine kinase n=1 Tax=Paludihabitans sp. MB14-C6 TaxID=3070656 RepID=UPI0027DE1665|nr:histidine kinase [Paludicola sp. MB14-C6]WMJ23536.1 histidine kinase [Paludicola sp. MB14-C6]
MRLISFTMVILFFVIIIITMTNFSSIKLVKTYNNFSESYNQLSLFYENLKGSSEHIKSYLYSYNTQDYDKYISSVNKAQGNLNYLKSHSKEELRFRCVLLENMFVNYKNLVKEITYDDMNHRITEDEYDELMHLHGLIDATSIDYFKYVTNDMLLIKESVLESLRMQIGIAIAIIIIMLAAAFIFVYFLIRSITKPIESIVENINSIKVGRFNVSEVKNGSKEIGVLLQAFDEMAISLQEYVNSIQEKAELKQKLLIKENENLRINKTLTLSKLKTLQSQINPHFLFNTLNIISKFAYIEGAQKTSDLMVITSDLLRYGLDKSDKVSDIIQEIECVKNYIRIQTARFGDRIKFETHIDDDIPTIKMPGMTLQPLIENSVTHGVKDIISNARVALVVQANENEIIIKIEDNGKGMDSDQLERLTMNIDNIDDIDEFAESTSIGIYNVRRRLEMFYGDKHKFNIESSIDCGVTVVICIYLSNNREDDVDVQPNYS